MQVEILQFGFFFLFSRYLICWPLFDFPLFFRPVAAAGRAIMIQSFDLCFVYLQQLEPYFSPPRFFDLRQPQVAARVHLRCDSFVSVQSLLSWVLFPTLPRATRVTFLFGAVFR